MPKDPEPGPPSEPTKSADRGDDFTDQLGALVQPIAQIGLDTVHDIATAVESTRAAGRDLWRLVNVVDRVRRVERSRDAGPKAIARKSTSDSELEVSGEGPRVDAPQPSAVVDNPVEPSTSNRPGIMGGLARIAETTLNPVRRAVTGAAGYADSQIAVRGDNYANLRTGGDRLIKQSLEPQSEFVRRHPAFALILTEITPDEARIVRFLAVAGPQPAIDLRTKTLFQIGSERIASGINMIAVMAGCRWPDSDQEYLANLNRLGLVRFSEEPVDDYRRYSLIEVQPRAVEALAKTRSAISIYRSIYLSVFGEQFCEVCIDDTGYNAGGWDTDERGDKIIGRGPPDPAARKH
jgi:abortive infection alpha-like protein